MTNEELQKRIESSAGLADIRDQIAAGLSANSVGQYSFSPLLILAIISLIIQIVQFCMTQRSDEEIFQDMKNVKDLPPRKLMRFKRRANVLWKQYCADNMIDEKTPNPIPAVVYSLGDKVSDSALGELITLAK